LKTVSLDSPQFTLEGALRDAAEGEVVFLTTADGARFALVAVDEGDEEVLALRANRDFLGYLDECKLRARRGPSRTLEEIRSRFSAEHPDEDVEANDLMSHEGTTP
jgi:hypothetical protein